MISVLFGDTHTSGDDGGEMRSSQRTLASLGGTALLRRASMHGFPKVVIHLVGVSEAESGHVFRTKKAKPCND